MRKYCKNVDILDYDFILESVCRCFKDKKERKDIKEIYKKYRTHENMALAIRQCFLCGDLKLVPVRMRKKIDGSSGKEREIGIMNIWNQLIEQVACDAIADCDARLGEFQIANIHGRGTHYGARFMQKWIREPDVQYVAKCDIKKCYQSCQKEKIIEWVEKHIKNDKLLWLVKELVASYPGKGLMIGSVLSMKLCNLYLSDLYHEVSENFYSIRRKKRVNWVKHVIFQMDDIVLLGTNSRNLHKAMDKISQALAKMGLQIKTTWMVFKKKAKQKGQMLDFLGFRFYVGKTALRRKLFRRLRRAYIRFGKHRTVKRARRCIAYWGYLLHSDSGKARKKLNADILFSNAKEIVSKCAQMPMYARMLFYA
jgi:hypothetical protein